MAVRLGHRVEQGEHSPEERERLIRLMCLFAELPEPPDPFGLYPRYAELRDRFLASIGGPDSEALEEAFLLLYAHIHGYEVPYTPTNDIAWWRPAGISAMWAGSPPSSRRRPSSSRTRCPGTSVPETGCRAFSYRS